MDNRRKRKENLCFFRVLLKFIVDISSGVRNGHFRLKALGSDVHKETGLKYERFSFSSGDSLFQKYLKYSFNVERKQNEKMI